MFCEQAKAYLSQKGVTYSERTVDLDRVALEELRNLGYLTTPVLKIGNTVIVGFDEPRINAALKTG